MIGRPYLGVVIVTHNHARTLAATIASLEAQTEPADHIVIVDSASDDVRYLAEVSEVARPRPEILTLSDNLGFTGANNVGWRRLAPPGDGLVGFLNPDIVVPPEGLRRLRDLSLEPRARDFGCISPRLVTWDFSVGRATGDLDSTGIFPRRTGGWADRRHDSPPRSDLLEAVPALCGAFMLARASALAETVLRGHEVWDETYFTYKEDLELSLRLRGAGWSLGLWHGLDVGHGRGWQQRQSMPRSSRILSARNEIRLHKRYARTRVPYSSLKLLYARFLEH